MDIPQKQRRVLLSCVSVTVTKWEGKYENFVDVMYEWSLGETGSSKESALARLMMLKEAFR